MRQFMREDEAELSLGEIRGPIAGQHNCRTDNSNKERARADWRLKQSWRTFQSHDLRKAAALLHKPWVGNRFRRSAQPPGGKPLNGQSQGKQPHPKNPNANENFVCGKLFL
jgi:hypothetical protein